METSPFAVLWSAPHMLYSPENVVKTVNGMHPDYDKHTPLSYDHEPVSEKICQNLNESYPVLDDWYFQYSGKKKTGIFSTPARSLTFFIECKSTCRSSAIPVFRELLTFAFFA